MAKRYRVTETQLEKIFESWEKKKITEMDNFNYPTGSDNPNAPWNQKDPNLTKGVKSEGKYILIYFDEDEYLFKNTETNQFIYTQDASWEDLTQRTIIDIKDQLADYLEIPVTIEKDEDGESEVYVDDWKDYITSEDVANALESYLNKNDSEVTTPDEWEMGAGKFVALTPESVDDIIYSSELKSKIK